VRTYRISVNDKEYVVEVDNPNASPATVHVNGKRFRVTIREKTTMAGPVPGLETRIEIEEPYVPAVTTTFVDATARLEPKPAETPAAASPPSEDTEQVIAPMPGKVMNIMVRVGDQVKRGDTLCNLEAMKMKSPIRSLSDGTIAQILISEGQNVNYGDVLFTLS